MFFQSFRARLSWFFVIIVILPIVMVTAVLFRLVTDSQQGRVDARLAQAQTSASNLYQTTQERASDAAEKIAGSEALAAAIASDDPDQLRAQLQREIESAGANYADIELPGRPVERAGEPGVAGASVRLDTGGMLRVTVSSAAGLAGAIHELTDLDVVVEPANVPAAVTLDAAQGVDLPSRGPVTLDDTDYRVTSFDTDDPSAGTTTVKLLIDSDAAEADGGDERLTVIALLLAFVLLAFLFAAAVSRSLQAQIGRLLQAARRLGGGDLDAEVPTEGNDEFAALGSEFNHMARQLKGRLDELEAERERLQLAIRRTGESIAKGTDRSALMEIVVQSAVDGIAASAGRASVREAPGGPLQRRANVGDARSLRGVLDRAEKEVLQTRESAEVTSQDEYALSHPLHQSDNGSKVIGLVSIARRGRPFSAADRELFHYLAGQAAISIENVDLHEAVQRQAVTDGLTGLFNHRRFQEVMTGEVERSKRFGQPLGLVMLDLDDFKDINDRWGHLQGDEVLREVARVLLDTSREIDEPARYGGEEMAVVLPQTDLDGAYEFAERLRARIEALEVPVLHGSGNVRITASVGVAALPDSAVPDKDALVQAADSALYRAKRLGKNRVVRAG
jgi:diguanylate cyclase (GGDEF)-like protein